MIGGMKTTLGAMLIAAAGTAGAGQAELPPINQNDHIVRSLLSAAVGDEIRKNCPTIGARIFRALSEAKKLERYALDQGYDEDEIEAYLDSKDEQKAMRALRDTYLANNGVKEGDADSYCALGRKEIERGSLTGKLLRAW